MNALLRLFRFVLKLQGAVVLGVQIDQNAGEVRVRVRRRKGSAPRCRRCGRVMGGKNQLKKQRWRHLDLLRTRCYIVAWIRQAHCIKHGRMLESVPWADGRSRHTIVLERAVAALVQVADKSAAERMFGVAWRTVGRIVKRVVQRHLPKDLLKGLEVIGVDEVSYKRGHRYLTTVTDLLTGRIVWIGKGKSAETLGLFFEELGDRRRQALQVICMDMSGAFRSAVEEWIPHVDVVYDRFHVVKLLLEAIDEIRREICRNTGGIARHPIKSMRFAFLRHPRNRTEKDIEILKQVARSNQGLLRAYQHRVNFENLWEIDDPEEARAFIMRWTRSALLSRREPLRKFARTLRKHIEGILGFFRHWRQTSGPIEGMNNKIKLAIHRAYGFHSLSSLMGMIHLCCSGINLQD